jgi:hypothetical protein
MFGIKDITQANLTDIPESCKSCIYWEFPEDFEKAMSSLDFAEIGQVTDNKKFEVYGRNGKVVLSASIDELKETWQKPLRW